MTTGNYFLSPFNRRTYTLPLGEADSAMNLRPANTRPIRNKEEFVQAYKYWSLDHSINSISEKLNVANRTLSKWVNVYKNAVEEEAVKDQPFQRLYMHHYGIDWADADRVLEAVRRYRDMRGEEPTGRLAIWLSRLSHLRVYKEGRTDRVFHFADKVVNHEIELLHGQPPTDTQEELSKELEVLQGGVR